MITQCSTFANGSAYTQSFATGGEFNQGAGGCFAAEGGIAMGAPSRPAPSLTGLGGIARRLPLLGGRNEDGTAIDATGGAGKFKVVNTTGTSCYLQSENANGTPQTKTDYVDFEAVIHDFYKQGENISVIVNAQYATGGGTVSVKTILADLYLLADDGTSGATLNTTAAATLTTSAADYTFSVTGSSLNPGARVLVRVKGVITETAGGGNATIRFNSVRLA